MVKKRHNKKIRSRSKICKYMPIQIDCHNLRQARQHFNDQHVYDALKSQNSKQLNKYANKRALTRVLTETNLLYDELLCKCANNDIMCRILAGRISKNASRQSTADETIQICACMTTAAQFGIKIKRLTTTAFRPHKNGEIVSRQKMKASNIAKHECLKSFDGRITGKMTGWIFAKIVYGAGGHQDNVFEEADALCNWVRQYHCGESTKYILLIDTDLADKVAELQKKYADVSNIIITDHYAFQQYIIDHYGGDDVSDCVLEQLWNDGLCD